LSIKILWATISPISFTERFTDGSLSTKLAIVKQILRLPTPISVKSAFFSGFYKQDEMSSIVRKVSLLSAMEQVHATSFPQL